MWKLVSEEMPKERPSVFARLKGTDNWKKGTIRGTGGVEKKRPGPKPKEIRQMVVKPLPDCVKKAITERMIRLTEEIEKKTAELEELDAYMKEEKA